MKMDNIKKQADDELDYQLKIEELHKEAIFKHETLLKLCDESSKILDEKRKTFFDNFIRDYKNYFIENGFTLTDSLKSEDKTYDTMMKFTYKNITFSLSGICYDATQMHFTNDKTDDKRISEVIWIALPIDCPDYFHNKKLTIVGEHDFSRLFKTGNEDPTDLFKIFVKNLKTEKEMENLFKILEINMNHFKECIDKKDSIKFFIHRHGDDKMYEGFADFIAII